MDDQLRNVKVSVLLDRREFDRFEAYCREKGFKKSTLVARLIRDYLDQQDYQTQRSLPFAAEEGASYRR